jgi:hypothetical protein
MRVMVIVKATKEAEAEDNPFDVEAPPRYSRRWGSTTRSW